MGIDAEMFVRVRRKVSDTEVRQLRYRMVSALGADRFWILTNGRCPDAPAPVERNPDDEDFPFTPRHAMERVTHYTQDGPDILPEPGETLLRVYPATRYYGEDYERGDLVSLIAIAKWLEDATGGAVWYGGDSSGCCAEPFGPEEREHLWRHFCRAGHDPYRGGFARLDGDTSVMLCTFCEMPMTRNGWGQTYVGYDCHGCGERLESRDSGRTFTRKAERKAAARED